MKEQLNFKIFWEKLIRELSSRKTIRNWTQNNGYIGEDFTVVYINAPNTIEKGYVEVDPPSAKTIQKVKKHSFSNIYDYWSRYRKGLIQRSFLTHKKKNPNATRHSKYIISILHQYEYLME